MSYQPKVRKALSNNNSDKKTKANNSSGNKSKGSNSVKKGGSSNVSKVGSNCGTRPDQILSSTMNSSVGSSATNLTCDVSSIDNPGSRNASQCPKDQDKEESKAVPKAKALTWAEKKEIAYGAHILKLYMSNLLTQKAKSEAEFHFSELEEEKRKLGDEISILKKWLKEVSSLQERDAKIKELDNICTEVEDYIHQLEILLLKVNQYMKIDDGKVPLSVLKVPDGSRDEFLSNIQELSNIRNEIVSIVKPHEESNKRAVQKYEAVVSKAVELRSLIRDCSSILPEVMSGCFRALTLKSCLTRPYEDFQLNKLGFQLDNAGPSSANGQ